ncbi:hypothetical protein [Nesterenkonia sp.]|uniref:hypothetical protein n=1 Tax=Nesterenkonia sp. TaxID=704201 RepID=UPI00261BD8AD|nr:hypothetical protein [Nesterenkonia sp.]
MSSDPTKVPKYPVYQVLYDEQTDDTDPTRSQPRVELDGIRVEPAVGQTATEAAIAAVARKAAEHGRDAVRVIVTTPEGDRWPMVVTRNGEAIEVPEAESVAPKGSKKPLIIAATALIAIAAAGGAAAVIVTAEDSPEPAVETEPQNQWEPPNAGAQVPVGLPEGFSSTAAWAWSVSRDSGALALSSGTIVIRDDDGYLLGISPEDGRQIWRSPTAPRSADSLHETTWAGHSVLVETSTQRLQLWPVPTEPTDEPVEPTTIELVSGAEVSFAGDAPLIYLGDYVVATDAGDGSLTEAEVPAGAHPVSVVEDDIVSLGETYVYRTPRNGDEHTSESTELQHHSAVQTERPQAIWPLTHDVAAALYEGDDEEPLLQVFNLTNGERISSRYVEAPPHQEDEVLVDPEAETAVIGAVAIRWGADEDVITEVNTLRDAVLDGTTLWGQSSDGPARVDISVDGAEPEPYDTFRDTDPPPVLVTDDAAYVEAPRVEDTFLYRIERQPNPGPSEETEDDHS